MKSVSLLLAAVVLLFHQNAHSYLEPQEPVATGFAAKGDTAIRYSPFESSTVEEYIFAGTDIPLICWYQNDGVFWYLADWYMCQVGPAYFTWLKLWCDEETTQVYVKVEEVDIVDEEFEVLSQEICPEYV